MTYKALPHVTTCHPQARNRIWVDDLSQRMQASRRALRADMVHVLTGTCMALQDYGLSIATKSAIVCTHIQDA
eukprot:836569-Pyramimonas_sp.AAC.1